MAIEKNDGKTGGESKGIKRGKREENKNKTGNARVLLGCS